MITYDYVQFCAVLWSDAAFFQDANERAKISLKIRLRYLNSPIIHPLIHLWHRCLSRLQYSMLKEKTFNGLKELSHGILNHFSKVQNYLEIEGNLINVIAY